MDRVDSIIEVVRMDNGQIVADGMTKEILEDEKFLNEHGLEKP